MDLNADLGEECGDDIAMLNIVTTANIAAGGHAGGGAVLLRTVEVAAARGINIGAHISYPDREGFGRTSLLDQVPESELLLALVEQICAVSAAAKMFGAVVTHVKPHGALYNDAAKNISAASLVLSTLEMAAELLSGPGLLPVMGLPNSILQTEAELNEFPFIPEAFADRRYSADGTLVPRTEPGAVLEDPRDVVEQALNLSLENRVMASGKKVVPVWVETLCLHGDTPGSVALAHSVREALSAAGVHISGETVRVTS